MVKPYFLLFFIAAFSFGINAQNTSTPEGRWQTVDDETGVVKSVIEIYREGNTYSGKIAEILTDNKDAICNKCDGKQKGKPMLGLVIIKDLKTSGDYWKGGTILDPQKGANYRLLVASC